MTPSDVVLSYFSETYEDARLKFLKTAETAAYHVTSYRHPSATGPDGSDLYMDIAAGGPADSAKGLLLISATHGVEGFCGSACQIGYLQSRELQALAAEARVIIVHALNPYGFAWQRRVNEDNVDLNRNFRDHDKPRPINNGYNELAHIIAPKDISAASIEDADQLFFDYGREHGFGALQRAISGGQYEHADGLYYGGREPTWSNRTFTAALKENFSKTKIIAGIDFHTGLGPFGHCELISLEPEDAESSIKARAWWDGQVKSTKQGNSVSADLEGAIGTAMPRIVPGAATIFVAAEFGTIDPMDVLAATRDDNWLYNHGNPNNDQGAEIRRRMRDAFYPSSDDWKQKVWCQANDFIRKAIDGLASER